MPSDSHRVAILCEFGSVNGGEHSLLALVPAIRDRGWDPVVVAPAMNIRMWEHAATQVNVAALRSRGVTTLGPAAGDMACGEYGMGRMLGGNRRCEQDDSESSETHGLGSDQYNE